MLVIRGRQQTLPNGQPMCAKAPQARAVAELGLSVQRLLCKRQLNGEEAFHHRSRFELCPHFATCPYQRQIEDKGPAIRVMPHARLFLVDKMNEARRPDVAVIDESFHNAALRGLDKYRRPYIVIDRLAIGGAGQHILLVPRRDRKGTDHDATAELDQTGARCARALHRGGRLADFLAEGVTEGCARDAVKAAYRCVAPLAITPAMSEALQDERIAAYERQEALRVARFFQLLRQSLRAGIDPKCFEIDLKAKNRDGRLEGRCYMRWATNPKVGDAAVLMIDADFDETVARRFVPRLAKVTEIEAEPVNYTAMQAGDRRASMDMLCPSLEVRETIAETGRIPAELSRKDRTRINNCKRLHRLAETKAAGGRKGLVVSYLAVEEVLRTLPPIPDVEYGHFSALRGVNRWRDRDFCIIAGTPQTNEADLERMGAAMWHLSPEPIQAIEPDAKGERRYSREWRAIEMTDGSSVPVRVDSHPDERCARLLDLIRAEVGQAVGRLRLPHRPANRPCEILVLTNTPIPGLPMHQATTWQDATDVSPLDLMAARGIVLQRLRDIAKVLPELVESQQADPRSAVSKALTAAGLGPDELFTFAYKSPSIGKSEQFAAFRYRLTGERNSARAWIDLQRHPDPRAALEALLGPLALFELVEEPPAAGESEIAEAVGVDQSAVTRWVDEFMKLSASDNFIKPHDFTAPAPEPEPPAQHPPPLSAAAREALVHLRAWHVILPLPASMPAFDHEDAFIRGGTAAVLAAAFSAEPDPPPAAPPPKLPPRRGPLSPLAPDWYRQLVEEDSNRMETRS